MAKKDRKPQESEEMKKEANVTENQENAHEDEALIEIEQPDMELEFERVKNELELSKQRSSETTEQYLRLMAEFDNFRKRSRREMETLQEYASEKVLTALLPVLDDFDRTLSVIEKADNLSSVKEGINMVTDKLRKVLEKEGLNRIDSTGEEFSSDLHEAIHSIAADESKKGKVLEEVEKGYRLKDKVIRYAKVIVGE